MRGREIYNGGVSADESAILSHDTSAAVEWRQVEAWRRMSPLQKLQLVSDTTQAVLNLSMAGIRRRHPAASERECFLRLASVMLGADVARAVYPEAAQLIDLDRR